MEGDRNGRSTPPPSLDKEDETESEEGEDETSSDEELPPNPGNLEIVTKAEKIACKISSRLDIQIFEEK